MTIPGPETPRRIIDPFMTLLEKRVPRLGLTLHSGNKAPAGAVDPFISVAWSGKVIDKVPYIGPRPADGQPVWLLHQGSTILALAKGGIGEGGGGVSSHGALSGVTADQHHTRYTDAEAIAAIGTPWIAYTDTALLNYLPLSGGTLTGFLTLHAPPTDPMHAATKSYVDNAVTGQLTVVVAASNARDISKQKADFVCTGVDDHLVVQAAFDMLDASGGKIVLSEGRFMFGTAGVTTPSVPFHLHGMGSSATEIYCDVLGTPFALRNGTGVNAQRHQMVSDMVFHGRDKAVSAIVAVQAGNNTVRLENVVIHNFTSHGVNLPRPAGAWKFRRCYFYSNGGAGVQSREAGVDYLDCTFQQNGGGGLGIQQDGTSHISSCLFWSNTGNGISSGNAISQGFSNFIITDNIFLTNTGWAINIQDGDNNQVSNNIFQGNGSGSMAWGAGAFGVSNNNFISDNNQVGTGTFVTVASGSSVHRANNVVNGVLIDVPAGTPGPPGPPGDPGLVSYTHVQGAAAALWTITHPLPFQPNVNVVDSAGEQVEGEVDYVAADTITVAFSAAFTGAAYLS